MSEDRILAQLAPPPGGWQRLLTRRDTPPRGQLLSPLAATVALALVLLLVLPRPHELQLPWNGGRLVAQPSEGVGVRDVAHGSVTPLPSDDPRVSFYWLQDDKTR
jgi:hypothetical protein